MILEGLYAITPDWSNTARLIEATEAILRGGCRVVQYRHKDTTSCHRLEQAGALRQLTARFDALLIINDDVDLALSIAADGVHIGVDDGDVAEVRQRLSPNRLLGVSCYQSCTRAREAVAMGADYVAFGSFFPSPTKPLAKRAGLELLDPKSCPLPVPRVAIGGIVLENGAQLVNAGADMLAVISGVYDTATPEGVSQQFQSYFSVRKTQS